MTRERQIKRAKQVFDIEIAGLKKTRASVGAAFADAIRLLSRTLSSGGLIVVTGVGKNLHAAEKMSAIFASTGSRSVVLNPVQAMHGDLGIVRPGDVLVALSFSGESDEILRLVPVIRRHGLRILSLTGNAKSSLAKMSDLHLAVPCGKEACPFGMAPTTSVTATLAMGDALALVLMEERKFSLGDYAANHPAGAIGKALLLKVSDVMRTGARLALVSPAATVMEAALAMTNSHGGSAVVVGKKGELRGIFTDGDFRRVLATKDKGKRTKASVGSLLSSVLETPVSRYMTAKPAFVHDDVYAADLLKVFERKQIDDLPVVDGRGRVVGLVDLQDLPKMKVM